MSTELGCVAVDKAFDDVEAKVALEIRVAKKMADVSDSKSKEGLGQVYENDYVKEALGVQSEDKLSDVRILFNSLWPAQRPFFVVVARAP